MSVLTKSYVVTMPDGSKWSVSVQHIALHRANYYAEADLLNEDLKATVELFESDEFEIEDWANNNMDWDDVKDVAKCIKPAEVDYQEGWVNGYFELV